MRTHILTDLGFGDGGKGTLTDSLARQLGAGMVVRYNGGSQAAHTVITPGGTKHTFHQFGSATLSGDVQTLLSRYMLVNPLALWYEAAALRKLGVASPLSRIFVDGEAMITTPYHVVANRIREFDRGKNRHGSCGQGIGETMADSIDHPEMVIRARDVVDPIIFAQKLAEQRDYKRQHLSEIVARVRQEPDLPEIVSEAIRILYSEQEFKDTVKVYGDILTSCQIVSGTDFLSDRFKSTPVVFEGAQGVLLDQDWGFHPFTTWSTTTSHNALRLISETGVDTEPIVVGIVRAYQTRHGAGPLPTESPFLQKRLVDPNNPTNTWQGEFRFGWFDEILTRYAIAVNGGIDYLAITSLDSAMPLERIRTARTYYGMSDLPIGKPGDQRHQEKLTSILQSARVVWRHHGRSDNYAERLASLLSTKLGITSFGPQSDQKQFHWQ